MVYRFLCNPVSICTKVVFVSVSYGWVLEGNRLLGQCIFFFFYCSTHSLLCLLFVIWGFWKICYENTDQFHYRTFCQMFGMIELKYDFYVCRYTRERNSILTKNTLYSITPNISYEIEVFDDRIHASLQLLSVNKKS